MLAAVYSLATWTSSLREEGESCSPRKPPHFPVVFYATYQIWYSPIVKKQPLAQGRVGRKGAGEIQEIIDLHYSSHMFIMIYVNLVFLTELSHYGIVYQIT